MSVDDFPTYKRYWPRLRQLIEQIGLTAHCMSPNHDSGSHCQCIHIADGWVLADNGFIYPPEDVIYDDD